MKRLITYMLLYAYALVLIKPVVPVVADFVAHTFYELEHLQVVHQHNGVYHVDAEIQEQNKDGDTSGKTIVTNFTDAAPHELSTFTFSPLRFPLSLVHRSIDLALFPTEHSVPLYPPPKQFV